LEELLDQESALVRVPVVFTPRFSIPFWRDDDRATLILELLDQRIGIVAFVPEERRRFTVFEDS
jgi:hypothetical protein